MKQSGGSIGISRRGRVVFAVVAHVVLAAVIGVVSASSDPAAEASEADRSGYLVGVGRASTDPVGQVCIGGYGFTCNRPSQGIKDPLEARALAVTGADGESVVIVTATAVGWFAAYKPEFGPNGIYDVRQRIAAQIPVPADHVIIVADHSHAAPDTIGIWGGVDKAYMERLADGAVSAAVGAFADRRPAQLSVAAVDGPPLESSYRRGPTDDGAMDNTFRALFADGPDGERIATFTNYAPHATVCGDCDDHLSGDWTTWVAQEAEELWGGQGFGAVGALGATDWRKHGSLHEREEEARDRLRTLLAAADAAARPVVGTQVGVETRFVREAMTQPVLGLNLVPTGILNYGEGDIRMDRAVTPPFLTGTVIGTYASAVRLGDVFLSTMPGEPFPQLAEAVRDGVTGPQEYFLLGAANDFLGYMVADTKAYLQTLAEGAAFLAGCPEQELFNILGLDHDPACPDHWTLMVSPTIGRHLVCVIQDGAAALGFAATPGAHCPLLTLLDGHDAPDEHPGAAPAAEPPDQGTDPDPAPPHPNPGQLRAGVASRDASWHLGASGGQFADTGFPISEDRVDPFLHATRKEPADAIYSRSLTRALVVEDGAGERVAVVANDLYLPNDILNRRVADLLREHDLAVAAGLAEGPVVGIDDENLAVTVSHNHNSPFYSTPAWGTWIFQDVVDLRFFDYMARTMADAVIEAAGELRPVRMGGATVPFNEIGSHTYGPRVADDGTPAGQPYSHTTGQMSLIRFDDITDPANPTPYANWVTLGIHPEWTWGYDVFNGDVTHAAMKIIDRELGTTTVMSQRETGSSGPHTDTRVHEPEHRREFQDSGFENLDVAGRLWADAIHDAYRAIDEELPTEPYDADAPRRSGAPVHVVPFSSDASVASVSRRVAPPAERPVPGVSNCNTSSLFHGHVQLPILGFPDCDDTLAEIGVPVFDALPFESRAIYDQLKELGIPIPDSYFGPSLTAVEETAAVHLMAFRLGDIAVTFCPCEQFTDTALNIETRLDRIDGNEWVGWDWTRHTTPTGRDFCVRNDDTTWTCADPRQPDRDLDPVSDLEYRRMVAQINNDAAGWEDDLASLFGASEPHDPDDIFGNFTHGERTDTGYGMVVAVGMANDYFGYVPNYREMRAHEHYRKALNGLGPHGADFLATRLVDLAASLNGGPLPPVRPLDLVYQAEAARVDVLTKALGALATADHAVWDTIAYVDGGTPSITQQPTDITRYDATHLTFVGGSNWTDMPVVRVERLDGEDWVPYADQHGDVPMMVEFPSPAEVVDVVAGQFEWRWTASFEAFGSQVPLPDASGVVRSATPAGTYRFVVDGHHRSGLAQVESYHLASEPFAVSPWDGVVLDTVEVSEETVAVTFGPVSQFEDGEHSSVVGPVAYPDGYDSPFQVLNGDRQLFHYGRVDPSQHQWYCPFCRFHAWADSGAVESVTFTVDPCGRADRVEGVEVDERWVADVRLRPHDLLVIEPGNAVTEHGEINGGMLHVAAERNAGNDPGPCLLHGGDMVGASSSRPLPAPGAGMSLLAILALALSSGLLWRAIRRPDTLGR